MHTFVVYFRVHVSRDHMGFAANTAIVYGFRNSICCMRVNISKTFIFYCIYYYKDYCYYYLILL